MAAFAVAEASDGYVTVARGEVAGENWTLGLVGHREQRCALLALSGGSHGGGASTCEVAGEPPELWQRKFGNADERAAVEFDLTKPSVRKLKVLLGHPGGHLSRPTWQTVSTRRLTPAQATEAHLRRNFRFAVLSGPGPNLCVEKVRAFGRDGKLLESISVPCEY